MFRKKFRRLDPCRHERGGTPPTTYNRTKHVHWPFVCNLRRKGEMNPENCYNDNDCRYEHFPIKSEKRQRSMHLPHQFERRAAV